MVDAGQISQEKLEKLKETIINNQDISKTELMLIFPSAFRRITEVALNMNKNIWDLEVIKHYFLNKHNDYIDEKEGNYKNFGQTFRDFCKVYKGKVIQKNDNVLTVHLDNDGKYTTRDVFNDILPEAKVGDIVTIHQAFAVEVIE